MKKLRLVAALVLAQAVLVGAYLVVERSQPESAPFQWERLDEPAPNLVIERRSGESVDPPEQAYLVHFWATWCAPCQEELPALLGAAEARGIPLLAVTDESWTLLEGYFDGEIPAQIVHDPAGTADESWRVSGLPDTFAVRDGKVVGRMGGARSWTTPGAIDFLDGLNGQEATNE